MDNTYMFRLEVIATIKDNQIEYKEKVTAVKVAKEIDNKILIQVAKRLYVKINKNKLEKIDYSTNDLSNGIISCNMRTLDISNKEKLFKILKERIKEMARENVNKAKLYEQLISSI